LPLAALTEAIHDRRQTTKDVSPQMQNMERASPPSDLESDPNFITSLARGLAVMREFANHKGHLTIATLARHTGIPRAAVRRCLYTLTRLGYVEQKHGKLFSLRPTVLSLSRAYLRSTSLVSAAQPLLDNLSASLHELASVALLDGDDVFYLARSSSTHRIISVDLDVGSRLPAYCTSMGRVLLAYLPAPQLNAYFIRVSFTKWTNRTIVSRTRLRQELVGVARGGFAIVDQELETGLRSIAVPVHDAGGAVVAAMSVSTQASRVTLVDLQRRLLPQLQAAAHELGVCMTA